MRLVCCHGNRTPNTPYETVIIHQGAYWHSGCVEHYENVTTSEDDEIFDNQNEMERWNAFDLNEGEELELKTKA